MNAIEFVDSLKGTIKTEDLDKMPVNKYFDTLAGKMIMSFLSERVSIINTKAFELVDFNVTSELKKNPLYKGRDFFSDMKALGFTYEITSYHQDEAPIKTYLFRI